MRESKTMLMVQKGGHRDDFEEHEDNFETNSSGCITDDK